MAVRPYANDITEVTAGTGIRGHPNLKCNCPDLAINTLDTLKRL